MHYIFGNEAENKI